MNSALHVIPTVSNQGLLSRAEMERRRLAAAADFEAGITPSKLAVKLQISSATAFKWSRNFRNGGLESLRSRKTPGRPSRLTAEQLRQVAELYAQGPQQFGYTRWTWSRLAAVIKDQIGIAYHPDHVCKIAQQLGLSRMRRSSCQ